MANEQLENSAISSNDSCDDSIVSN